MPISDVASLVGGAVLGPPLSEMFKLAIEGAKKVKDFKPLSEDLASTMERLVPIINDIVSMHGHSAIGTRELEFLMNTVQRAEEMVRKCSRVQWYNIAEKAWYTRKIKGINQDVLKFTQFDLQFIIHRDQQRFMRSVQGMIPRMGLSDARKELSETFVVPEPRELDISWLDRAFGKLKMMLLEDGEVTIVVVSAPSACGKTTLVTRLCHDTDIKGKFKHIFFITVSKSPNTRIMLNILLQHTACKANEFEKSLDAKLCIEQVLKQLGPNGSILVVLDDVWPEEEYLVKKFLIQLKDYKILVTSRFEFPSLGPTFQLESFISEDVKNFFTECTPQPDNSLSCAKRDHLLQKIFKPCNRSPFAVTTPCSICVGCNSVIEDGCLVNVLGVPWHSDCFCCDACHKPISTDEIGNHVSNRRGKFHISCYREMRHPTCSVCKEKIPSTAEGIMYSYHPFWQEKYCPSHDVDGTYKCCSCERLEPKGANYVMLRDGRWLCLECKDSAIMDTYACHLHLEIREFFEGLNMEVDQDFPVYLVEYGVLNKTLEEEKDLTKEVSRGICFSEERILSSNEAVDMVTEAQTVSVAEVTAILILYGLPRLLTGSILAHEMMHAYLRCTGCKNLDILLEEGICQMLSFMWLQSQTDVTTTDATAASSSHTPPATTTSKTGKWSEFDKKLLEFCKVQIKTDDSPVFGVGFRKVYEMVRNSSLPVPDALKEIIRQG